MVTDNQVAKQVEKNDKLRAELASLQSDRLSAEASAVNEVKLTKLKQEELTLQREVEYAKRLKAAQASQASGNAEITPTGPVENAAPENKEK